MRRVLVQWIGHSDLRAMAVALPAAQRDEVMKKLKGECPRDGDLGPIKTYRPNLIDLLDDSSFQAPVPRVVVSRMHGLRIKGNQAVHGNQGDTTTALLLLKEAFDLARRGGRG